MVNVLDEEHEKIRKQEAIDAHEPTIADLQLQLEQIKMMLEKQAK